jgi:hypothetical protein
LGLYFTAFFPSVNQNFQISPTKSSFILIIRLDQTYQQSEKESKPWIQSFQTSNLNGKNLQR